eukprot:CCRYP_005215-RA/>CCRYP_005215-RA protein AED:0.30 eAED:0.30 QI:0/-1/0/1/-1/1/1/0/268
MSNRMRQRFRERSRGRVQQVCRHRYDMRAPKPDDGSYPVPPKEVLVQSFDTKLWNGRWYITAGQNKLFDTFPCQVHFFTETAPGKFFGKLNWRIEEPDGEFFTRDALQRFVQDPANPAHLINHDNEYLHYKDDWYIVDYAADDNKEGVPPFAFVYYRGENDAWVGYGGAVIYTRDSKLPESLLPLREAAKKSISTSIRTLLLRTIPVRHLKRERKLFFVRNSQEKWRFKQSNRFSSKLCLRELQRPIQYRQKRGWWRMRLRRLRRSAV